MSQSKENVHTGHRDRMRQRFLENGLDHFQPHEVLELLLYNSISRKDTNQLAHHILAHFHGSFPAVLEAGYEQLRKVPGIGDKTACMLTLQLEVYRYYEQKRRQEKGLILNSPNKIKEYAKPLFMNCYNERLYLICLSPAMQVIRSIMLAEGSFDRVTVPVKKVLDVAMKQHASSIILAHNHPNGIARFSSGDYDYTMYINRGMKAAEIGLEDHVLVTEDETITLLEQGGIEQWMELYRD